jgi:hypothetical protein
VDARGELSELIDAEVERALETTLHVLEAELLGLLIRPADTRPRAGDT